MTNAPTTDTGRVLNAAADVPDVRDRPYEPNLRPVLDEKAPARDRIEILDQGQEGACTGFGLAAVVNLQRRLNYGAEAPAVSARMFYEMARRFDEWTGEDYEGSSIRGALRGFFNNGVCTDEAWPYDPTDPGYLTLNRAKDARAISLGAYYSVRQDTAEMHAALTEAGAVYVSARVHDGWFSADGGVITPQPLHPTGGHAFAIVGYTTVGFWVQNSLGIGLGRQWPGTVDLRGLGAVGDRRLGAARRGADTDCVRRALAIWIRSRRLAFGSGQRPSAARHRRALRPHRRRRFPSARMLPFRARRRIRGDNHTPPPTGQSLLTVANLSRTLPKGFAIGFQESNFFLGARPAEHLVSVWKPAKPANDIPVPCPPLNAALHMRFPFSGGFPQELV